MVMVLGVLRICWRRSVTSRLLPNSFMHNDLLSVQIRMVVDCVQCSAIQFVARIMAHTSSSYEQVMALPLSLRVSTTIGSSASPIVITAAAPPSSLLLLAESSV